MFKLSPALETILTFRTIDIIAALGLFLPLSIGQLDIAIAGYMAMGAYTSAVLTRDLHAPFALALVAGGLLASLFAVAVAFMATRTRLKGFAFAVVSLGLAEITRVALENLDFTGGTLGFRQIAPYTTLPGALLVLLLVIAFYVLMGRSHLGRAQRAINDDEPAAEAMGINLLVNKLFVFGAGAFIGGLAGGLYAHYALYLEPKQFGFSRLIELQLPIVFGGLETFWGAIFGTAILGLLPEITRSLASLRLIFYAAVTILVVVLRPQGVITRRMLSALRDFWVRHRPGKRAANRVGG